MSNEIKIELLRRARILIEGKTQTYICLAIQIEADKATAEVRKYADELVQNIMDVQLSGPMFLRGWIQLNRSDLPCEAEDYRKYRLQWIDEMIRRLENNEPFVPLTSLDIFHV